MNGPFDLQNRVVVVTGGLGQLGRQFTTALVAGGARAAVLDVNGESRRGQLGPLGDSPNVMTLDADVTRRDSLEAALAKINGAWGPVYGLINNAALDSPPNSPAEENGPFETYPESSWRKVLDVNATGVFLCDQVFGAQMAEAGAGSIVHICSIYGVVSPDQRLYKYRAKDGREFFKPVAYSASKSLLLNLTRYLATYWAPKGVRVNTLTFGGVFNSQDDEFLRGYCAKVPLGRMARPDEYNGAVVFLMSDAASYMTGSNMVIDGGWTAW